MRSTERLMIISFILNTIYLEWETPLTRIFMVTEHVYQFIWYVWFAVNGIVTLFKRKQH